MKTTIPKKKLDRLDADCHRLCNYIVENAQYCYENEHWHIYEHLIPLAQKLHLKKHIILQQLIVLQSQGYIQLDVVKTNRDEFDFILIDVNIEYILS